MFVVVGLDSAAILSREHDKSVGRR
jgi:hypothetical protein